MLQDWTDQLPIYPPTTLFVLKPLSALPYEKATLLWYALSLAVYVAGVLWAFLFSPFLRGDPVVFRVTVAVLALHFPKMIQCLSFGNPSLMVTGLMLFAVFDDVGARYVPRLICGALAVWLKVTSALPLMLLLAFADRMHRRRAWITVITFAVITTAMLLYARNPAGMHHWSADLRQNIALGEQNGMSASANISPSNVLLNAANLPGYFSRNPLVISIFVCAIVGLIGFVLLRSINRLYRAVQWEHDGYLVAVASVAAVSLLPVYHRFCDIGLLIFILPWLIHRVSSRVDSFTFPITVCLGLLYFSWERRMHLNRLTGKMLQTAEFLYYRGDALLVLVLTLLLVTATYRIAYFEDRRTVSS